MERSRDIYIEEEGIYSVLKYLVFIWLRCYDLSIVEYPRQTDGHLSDYLVDILKLII